MAVHPTLLSCYGFLCAVACSVSAIAGNRMAFGGNKESKQVKVGMTTLETLAGKNVQDKEGWAWLTAIVANS